MASPIYSFLINDIKGKAFDMSSLKGKVVCVVNTASKCGLTPQFKGLEELHKKYQDQGLVVLGFPSNQFNQELTGGEEIASFCSKNYGVTFQMMQQVEVNGSKEDPIYHYIKAEKTFMGLKAIKWNFEKFLIDRNGKVFERYAPTSEPAKMETDIVKLLEMKAE